MLKVRGVATVFATVLAVSLTACGSHQSADTAAAQSDGSSVASSGAQGQSSSKSSGSSAGSSRNQGSGAPAAARDKGARAAAGHLPKGSYDDTTGTRARHPKNQNAVLSQLPGASSARGCVVVGNRTDVRGGSLAMGNFADARAKFRKAKNAYVADESFFYVIPASRSVGRVTVTATRLGRSGAPVRATSTDPEQAAQWKYFPIHLTLPASGTWRFHVSTPTASSCFDARFTT
jgi:hypothetical protein